VLYHTPALPAAFLLDPVNLRMSEAGIVDLPFEVLGNEEQIEAVSDISHLASSQADAIIV
jgi:hypothetical protein